MAELLSPGKIVFILIVAFFIFGPKKLPELGRAAGKTLVEFKRSFSNIMDNDTQPSENPDKTRESNEKTRDIS